VSEEVVDEQPENANASVRAKERAGAKERALARIDMGREGVVFRIEYIWGFSLSIYYKSQFMRGYSSLFMF
jgi:hypothetical protein